MRLIELQPHDSWIIDRFHLSARARRLQVSGNPAQYDDLGAFRREQDLLRRLARESILPALELDTTDGDLDALCGQVAGGMASTGGLWARQGPADASAEPAEAR